jgi:hypothetical protein
VSDQDPEGNYNSENSLRIGRYYQFWQWIYLKFDLSEIPSGISPENITSAKLYLFAYYKYSRGFNVRCCKVDDDSWLDTIVSWNTKPAPGATLDTKYVDATGYDSPVSYYWDVTSFVRQEFAGDKTVSFCMLPPDNLENSVSRAFWPKDWYENRVHPFLQIIYAAGALPPRGVSVSISPGSQNGSPGATLTYTVMVRNTGSLDDNYSLTKSDNSSWSLNLSPSTLSLAAGASGMATLTVTIPSGAENDTRDSVTVTATSQTDNTVSNSASCVAYCIIGGVPVPGKGVQVLISPTSKSGKPGEVLDFSVTVKNTGTITDKFDLTASDTKGWSPTLSITSTTLVAGGQRSGIRLRIQIPGNAADGDSTTIVVTATGTGYENSTTCEATATAGGGISLFVYGGIIALVIVIIAGVLIIR